MRTLTNQLAQYAAYHRDRRNVAMHFIGIPLIVLSIAVLLARPDVDVFGVSVTPIMPIAIAVCIYYLILDLRFGIGMTALIALAVWVGQLIALEETAVWLAAGIALFVVGWIFQFVGHYFEGRKPAFVDDVIGLLIGPLFVYAEAAFALGLRRDLHTAIEQQLAHGAAATGETSALDQV
jgi:uncharacterized membrane protein YGL010W